MVQQVPLLYFMLCESTTVILSTAAAMLRLLDIFIVDKGHIRGSPCAVRKCARIDHLSRRHDMIAWPCSALRVRHPRDLCLVGIGEHPQYLLRQL